MNYIHLKSRKTYEVLSLDVTNATNAQDSQRMVLYLGDKRDGSGKRGIYVREFNEFNEKFIPER